MGILYDGLIDAAMKRYGVPEWLRPYIYRYAKESNINMIRQAISFINVRRKKGEVTARHVRLPNGVVFDIDAVVHILNQFYYGVESTGKIAARWAAERPLNGAEEMRDHFYALSKERAKHARALRNMIEALGHKVDKPTKQIAEVFNSIADLSEWPERLVATDVIIRDAYSRPFGFIFYKVFYPVSPEFMRSLGKIFIADQSKNARAEAMIKEAIDEGALAPGRTIELSEQLLAQIYKSIEAEMPLARRAGIEPEAKLLRDISIAYPLHTLEGLGVGLDIEKEMKRITSNGK